MAKILHPKIKELKQRSAPIQYSSVNVDATGKLNDSFPSSNFDERVVAGFGVTWGNRNDYGEKFVKGCASKSINERGPKSTAKMPIKMLNFHNQKEPLALMDALEETEFGLYFRSKPFDEVDYADRMLIHLRSGTIDNFSIGWNFVWDKIEYEESSDSLIILEMELYEISPVSLAADPNTYAMRSKEAWEDLTDEIDDFIKSLPRRDQLEARTLFKRHKALIESEPPTDGNALRNRKPNKGVDYNYLLKNFKK